MRKGRMSVEVPMAIAAIDPVSGREEKPSGSTEDVASTKKEKRRATIERRVAHLEREFGLMKAMVSSMADGHPPRSGRKGYWPDLTPFY